MSRNIQYVWSILCSGVSIDQDTNNLTLFNTIEQIKIPEDKLVSTEDKKGLVIPIGFNLVTMWRRLNSELVEKAEVEVEVIDPSGSKRKSSSYSLEFKEGIRRIRSKVRWGGIKVTTSGTYKFNVSMKEEGGKTFTKVGEVYLDIKILPSKKE